MHEIRIVASLPTLPRVGRVAPEKTSTKTDAILARLSERNCGEAVNHVHARSCTLYEQELTKCFTSSKLRSSAILKPRA